MKIAIVYDWIDSWGGIERVLLVLREMFPSAQFYTSYVDQKKSHWAKNISFKTSFIQKAPAFIKGNRVLSIPLYPFAFESFDFSRYNLVISVSSSFAKAVITRPESLHICYLLTPTRFLWTSPNEYITPVLTKPYINYLKKWDLISSHRPDEYISLSKTVQSRLKDIYHLDSDVIYPPFDVDYWKNIKLQDFPKYRSPTTNYFLSVSRLEPYKKINLLIETFNELEDKSLIVVGKGSLLSKLKRSAGVNIHFLQDISDEELAKLYFHAEALLMPQEEDFGLTPLEAQFFGCPVIAYKKGGATETVVEGKTGIFFAHQTAEAIHTTLVKYATISYTLKESTKRFGPENVKKFSKERFEKQIQSFIKEKLKR